MLPSPYGSGLGFWSFRFSRPYLRSLSLRPDDSLTILKMALSIGFRDSVSLHSAIQATRLLTVTSVGLPPTEHTSFCWTRFRTAGFPRYGWKAGVSDGAFPGHRWLKPAPGIRHLTPGLPPSFAHCGVRIGCPALCRAEGSFVCRRGVGLYSAPGALAPVRVILSRSIHAYWPHPTHSQAHHDFADCATYTRCLRCAGAPRRPTSGSELSLHIPSWHAVPYVPGEIGIVLIQFFNSDIGLRRDLSGSALPFILPSVSSRARVSGLTGSPSLRPVRSLAPLTDLTGISPSHRGFYIQAFHGLVTLPAAGDNYDSYWTSSVGGTFTHWNGSYPRCTRSGRAGFPHPALALGNDAQTA